MRKRLVALLTVSFALFVSEASADGQQNGELYEDADTELPVGPLLVGGLGATMIAVGAGFGWQADQEYDEYKSSPSAGLADDVENHALTANLLMFSGGAVVLVSVIWWLFSLGDNEESDTTFQLSISSWTPVYAPRRIGLSVTF